MEINPTNSSSKKRKIIHKEHEVEDDEEHEDEAKMEAFFALVRNIRDTRDRWINFRSSGDSSKNKRVCKENRVAEVWKPTFQLEDFAEEKAPQPSVPLIAGGVSDQRNNCAKEEEAEKGIDLRLSL